MLVNSRYNSDKLMAMRFRSTDNNPWLCKSQTKTNSLTDKHNACSFIDEEAFINPEKNGTNVSPPKEGDY